MATYEQAGVDIAAGDRFAEMIAEQAVGFHINTDTGGFAGSFPIPPGTVRCGGSVDGVGTKLVLLTLMGDYFTAGRDAATMAGVDMYVSGIRPMAAFDYIATERLDLDPDSHIWIVNGIMERCRELGCEYLPGGETAEHPNVGLPEGHLDVAVFFVGIPDPELPTKTKENIRPGMKVWGWPSHGLGSNGYSLARKVFGLYEGFWARVLRAIFGGEYGRFSLIKYRLNKMVPKRYDDTGNRQYGFRAPLARLLLGPTCAYVPWVEQLRGKGARFLGHAHITGGGMPGNIPRILPENCVAEIDVSRWRVPSIFRLIHEKGNVPMAEMWKVFNMGIQMVSVTPADESLDPDLLPFPVPIGEIRERQPGEPQVQLHGELNW